MKTSMFRRKRMGRIGVAVAIVSLFSVVTAVSRDVVGSVILSTGAYVNGVAVPGSWTMVSGDVVSTTRGGDAQLRLSSRAQAQLGENTSVAVGRSGGRYELALKSGRLRAETSGNDAVAVKAGAFTVEPSQAGGSAYDVALLEGGTGVVTAEKGDARVTETKTGTVHVVPAGQTMTVGEGTTLEPVKKGASAMQAPALYIPTAAAFGVAIAAGVVIAVILVEGPLSAPSASPSSP